jgi:hypothetical protein
MNGKITESMREFSNDDKGYIRWVTDNPDGFVLNINRIPRSSYTVLHHATCNFISKDRDDGAYTGGDYRKVVSRNLDELRAFTRSLGRADGSFSKVCGHCNPISSIVTGVNESAPAQRKTPVAYDIKNNDLIAAQYEADKAGLFNPQDDQDARKKNMVAIVQRQGQPKFRQELLRAYNGRCAVTGCDVEAALEAAHIIPYNGPQTNHVSNGLLLRADLHTLFDLGLWTIHPDSFTVVLSDALLSTEYAALMDKTISPIKTVDYPNKGALKVRYGEYKKQHGDS